MFPLPNPVDPFLFIVCQGSSGVLISSTLGYCWAKDFLNQHTKLLRSTLGAGAVLDSEFQVIAYYQYI